MVIYETSGNLETFQEIWLWTFLWVLFSSLLVHLVVALASFLTLYKHKQGRWYFLSIAIVGVLMHITGGMLTCAVIAGVYRSLVLPMSRREALLWGGGQTVLVVCVSFARLLPTL